MMCAATCNACHLRDPSIRCSRDKLHGEGMSLDPAYQPGQLNAMFESIEERFKGIYDVQVDMLLTNPASRVVFILRRYRCLLHYFIWSLIHLCTLPTIRMAGVIYD